MAVSECQCSVQGDVEALFLTVDDDSQDDETGDGQHLIDGKVSAELVETGAGRFFFTFMMANQNSILERKNQHVYLGELEGWTYLSVGARSTKAERDEVSFQACESRRKPLLDGNGDNETDSNPRGRVDFVVPVTNKDGGGVTVMRSDQLRSRVTFPAEVTHSSAGKTIVQLYQ